MWWTLFFTPRGRGQYFSWVPQSLFSNTFNTWIYEATFKFFTHVFQEVLRDLGGFPRARLSFDDEDLVLVDGGQQVVSVGKDGKAASDFLHWLFFQLSLRQSRSILILNGTRSEEKAVWVFTVKQKNHNLFTVTVTSTRKISAVPAVSPKKSLNIITKD